MQTPPRTPNPTNMDIVFIPPNEMEEVCTPSRGKIEAVYNKQNTTTTTATMASPCANAMRKKINNVSLPSPPSRPSSPISPIKMMETKYQNLKTTTTTTTAAGPPKHVLVNLVASEIATTGNKQGILDEPTPTTSTTTQAPSKEDLYYAVMNGEAFDSNEAFEREIAKGWHDIGSPNSSFGQFSFVGLNLSNHSETSEWDESLPVNSKEASPPAPRRIMTTRSTHSFDTGDCFSMTEIEQIVSESMPADVRDKVPKEAWGKIFGNSPKVSSSQKEKVIREDHKEDNIMVDSDDDDNVIFHQSAHNDIDEDDDIYDDDDLYDDDDDHATVMSDVTDATLFRVAKEGFVANKQPQKARSADDDTHLTATRSSTSSASPSSPSKASQGTENIPGTGGGPKAPCLDRASTKKKKGLSVGFAMVQVRHYERILDINPAVTSGVALGIGWRFKRGGKFAVNEWEENKVNPRRSNELLLPRHVREWMALDLGYSKKDIAAATRVILKAKNKRKQTVQNLGVESVEEAVETASRCVKRILNMGRKKGLVKQ